MSLHRSRAGWIDVLRTDLFYAWRQLRRSPAFAAVAIASLAIGIGVNVTVFSAAHAFLAQDVNAPEPERLVRVYRGEHSPLPRDWYLALANGSRAAQAVIAEDMMAVGLVDGTERERIAASVVSENFFSTLGVLPSAGTVFTGEPNAPVGAVAVLSHRYWVTRFGADQRVVGRVVRINDQPFTIIGVAAEGFLSSQFGWGPQVFVPFSEWARLRGLPPDTRSMSSTYVVARLASDASAPQLSAELTVLAASFPRADSTHRRAGAFTVATAAGINEEVRGPVGAVSVFLQALVGLVLLIACLNLGNLLLARAVHRRREMAIRSALGVSRGRLVRQLLTESMLLTVAGGALGVGLAWFLAAMLPSLLPAMPQIAFDLTPDATVMAFAAALAVGTGLAFGLAPAMSASRTDLATLLRTASGAVSGRSRLRSVFLGAQVAMSLTLLIVSGLFLRGLSAARALDPGFDASGVVNVEVDLSLRSYDEIRGGAARDLVLARVRELPNVVEAAWVETPPLTGSNSGQGVLPASADQTDQRAVRGTIITNVSDGYFELMRQPMIAGRGIETTDRAGTPDVAVVNESFARMLWTVETAVGQQFRFFGEDELVTVVGVTPDVKYKSLNDRDEPMVYVASAQAYGAHGYVQARVREDSPAARAALRAAVAAVEPALPVPMPLSAAEAMSIVMVPARVGAIFLGAFGAIALLLATIGVYGVTAFLVGQRTSEIGVRAALGATAGSILRTMMRDTVRLVLVGAVVGLAGGAAIGTVAASQLHGVSSYDPAAFAGATALLLVVALVGTWLPARRAMRVDPATALRAE